MNDLRLNVADAAWLKRAHIDAEMSEYERGYSQATEDHAKTSEHLSDLSIELSIRSERLKKWINFLLPVSILLGMIAAIAIAALVKCQ